MKTLAHCCSVALMGLLMTMAPLSTASAQDKAVAVVSIAPLSKIYTDIEFAATAAGQPEIGAFAPIMAAGYTAGIDKSKPIGIAVMTDGLEFTPLVFIPVTNLEAFLLTPEEMFGEAEDAGDGVKMMEVGFAPFSMPVFFKENNGWLFLGQDKEKLANLPADPAALLGDLPKNYDFAIKGNLQNVPVLFREVILQQVVAGAETALIQEPGESDEDFAKRKGLVQVQLKQLERVFEEFVDLSLGFNVDPATKEAYLDINYSVVPGSQMSDQLALNKDLTSDFAGFFNEDTAVSLNMTVKAGEQDIAMAIEQMGAVREVAFDSLEVPEEHEEAVTKIIDLLFDSYIDTIKSGKLDFAAKLTLSEQTLTFLSAIKVADGRQIEDSLKGLADLVEDNPNFPGITWNAESHKGVSFHTMSIPTPAEEEVQKVFGESLAVVIGIGEDSAYLAFGEDAAGQLKAAIDQSVADGSVPVSPAKFSVALLPIMQFVSGFEDDAKVAAALAALEGSADKIQISGIMLENAARTRISIQEGVIKAIGAYTAGGEPEDEEVPGT